MTHWPASTPARTETALPIALALAGSFLLAAVALSWANSVHAAFQFDDWNVIVNEPRVHGVAAWWRSMPGIRPLLKLTYAVNYEISSAPVGFRLFNLSVHLLNTALLVVLLYRRARASLLAYPAGRTTPEVPGRLRSNATLLAVGAAALFALSPVQTEAVTYISGRSSALMALPCLAALWCWELALTRRHPWPLHAAGIACYAAAIAIKETAIVLPLALWLWQSTRASCPAAAAPPVKGASMWRSSERRALAGYAAIAVVALLVALISPTYQRLLDTSIHIRSVLTNLTVQWQAWSYLSLELVRLSALNADPQLQQVAPSSGPMAWLQGLLWIGLPLAAWLLRKQAPQACFGVLWFCLWLLPTNSLLPRLDPANDRQLYLALLGPAWLLTLALCRLENRRRYAGWAVLMIVCGILAVATAARNEIYRSEISFWQDARARAPSNARAANNLGIAFALACRDTEAALEFAAASALAPQDYRSRINLRLLQEHQLTRKAGNECHLLEP